MKKNNIVCGFIVLFLLLGVGIGGKYYLDFQNKKNVDKEIALYDKSIQNFINITSSDELYLGEKYSVLYFGRATCPYCRDFIPDLVAVSTDLDIPVYYIDTENLSTEITDMINYYHIEFVPSLIRVNNEDNTFDVFEEKKSTLTDFLSGVNI